MADDIKRDSEEFDGDIVAPEANPADEALVVNEGGDALEDGVVVEGLGVDQPGENLASDLLPDEVAPYQVAADETEAEELDGTTPVDPDVLVEDADQLAEAAAAESLLDETGEPVGNAAEGMSLRPQKKSAEVVRKDHATPRRDGAHGAVAKHRVGPAQFVRESVEELRKVIWPNGSQLWQYFVVVLCFVLFIIAFVSLLDFAFGWLLLKLLG